MNETHLFSGQVQDIIDWSTAIANCYDGKYGGHAEKKALLAVDIAQHASKLKHLINEMDNL